MEDVKITVRKRINIVQFQAMPNDAHWQGAILGLADDGKIYISEHNQNGSRWSVYVENKFKNESK